MLHSVALLRRHGGPFSGVTPTEHTAVAKGLELSAILYVNFSLLYECSISKPLEFPTPWESVILIIEKSWNQDLNMNNSYHDDSKKKKKKNWKRRRIVEVSSSSSDEDNAIENNSKENKVTYVQKIRKVNRNLTVEKNITQN